jgi:galactose mutarotase-like enzyme
MRLAQADLAIEVAARGAELSRIVFRGRDRLWSGDPTWWSYRAPILFPVVGKSRDGHVEIDGDRFPMQSHGFARERDFSSLPCPEGLLFEQRASAETKAQYPFDYRLTMAFQIAGDALIQTATVHNDGDRPMPYSFGYHPAFLWPIESGARDAQICRFEQEESAPIRRINAENGLLTRIRRPSPVKGRRLAFSDALFAQGALIFDAPRSRSVWFGEPGGEGLELRFPDSPQLGIWTKPGAPFLCLEPWHGLCGEIGGSPRIERRPGSATLAPGGSARYRIEMRFGAKDSGED